MIPYIVLVKLLIFRAILTFWNFPNRQKLRYSSFDASVLHAFADFVPRASNTAVRQHQQVLNSRMSLATVFGTPIQHPWQFLDSPLPRHELALYYPETTSLPEAFPNANLPHLR